MSMGRALLALTLMFWTTPTVASEIERLAKMGYGVIEQTNVMGEFNGCDFDKRIPLVNGLVFVCLTYGYTYSYSPEVYILQNVRTGHQTVVIGGQEFAGTLFRRR